MMLIKDLMIPIPVEIDVDYKPATPPCFSGHPDRWYDGEPEEIEVRPLSYGFPSDKDMMKTVTDWCEDNIDIIREKVLEELENDF